MIDLSHIRIDGGTQARVKLNNAAVVEYRDAILDGAEFPPVVLFHDGANHWLADGFHRYHGAKTAGRTTIAATIKTGSRRDAVLYSLKANSTHGLRRTNADKRRAVEMMLGDDEWKAWSDNKIAQACGVGNQLVGDVRKAIFVNHKDAPPIRTVERGGKVYQQDVSRIGKAVAAPAAAPAPAEPARVASPAPAGRPGTPHDNEAFRALFSLPPIQPTTSTDLAVPTLPPQTNVTGDNEVDAVLWLQSVVATGSQPLIDKAMQAAKRITTPMKALADRYAAHIVRSGGSTLQAACSTINFGDLEGGALRAIKKAQRQHEALSRFGSEEALFHDVPAEAACRTALDGLKRPESGFRDFDEDEAAERFVAHVELAPATLSDCLHGRAYWDDLYRLRHAVDDFGDPDPAGQAHDEYCFSSMARIRPRDTEEALAVFEYLQESEYMDRKEVPAILRNLIAGS